jgi:hypothetical protein
MALNRRITPNIQLPTSDLEHRISRDFIGRSTKNRKTTVEKFYTNLPEMVSIE